MPLPGGVMGLVSDKPQAGGAREKKLQRLKREDHTYVKHDKSFCDWKVLVGPTDWKEHAAGKIPDRFRVNNLPSYYDGAGIYELGVTPPAWLPPQKNSDAVFLKPQDVVVVYLGCADHVYHHLQRYGQTGAHLEGVRSTRLFTAKNESSGATPRKSDLDKSRSFPSAHSRTTSVDKAPGAGDGGYMSTRSSNASAMDAMDERMISSDMIGSSRSLRGPRLFSEVFALGCSVAFRWAATESKPAAEKAESELIDIFDYAWKRGGNFRQRSPDILAKIVQAGTLNSSDSFTCFGDYGLFKKNPPGITIPARRPPDDPTRAPITRTSSSSRSNHKFKTSPKSSEFTKLDIPVERCGILLDSGRPCSALPVKGGKRCLLHKKSTQKRPARVANMSPSHEVPKAVEEQGTSSCFPYLQSPSPTTTVPVMSSSDPPKRRGSLSFTSWLRTSELRLARSREWADQTTPAEKRSILTTCEESLESSSSPMCRSPTSRREICGLRLDDGTVCPEPPRPDRKRCAAHKGLRNVAPKSPTRSRNNIIPVRAI